MFFPQLCVTFVIYFLAIIARNNELWWVFMSPMEMLENWSVQLQIDLLDLKVDKKPVDKE